MSRRPEHQLPAELYYSADVARDYAFNSRVHAIQRRMTQRAVQLLALPAGEQCLLLDLGCGSGLCGEVLQHSGHTWVGTDISRPMLDLAKKREFDMANEADESEGGDEPTDSDAAASDEVDESESSDSDGSGDGSGEESEGGEAVVASQWAPMLPEADDQGPPMCEVMQADMGARVPFRPGVFDGAVSISAIQWLCNIDRRGQVPQRRLKALFQSLHHALRRGARAVFQFYPENAMQMDMISTAAMQCGFGGGVIVDFPHSTRARKYYLVVYAGFAPQGYQPPRPLSDASAFGGDEGWAEEAEEAEADSDGSCGPENQARVFPRDRQRMQKLGLLRHRKKRRGEARPEAGTKAWVLLKKADRRRKGLGEDKPDSKYTARKRRRAF